MILKQSKEWIFVVVIVVVVVCFVLLLLFFALYSFLAMLGSLRELLASNCGQPMLIVLFLACCDGERCVSLRWTHHGVTGRCMLLSGELTTV